MKYELRRTTLAFAASLAVLRFWIEVVTTTAFRNWSVISRVNNNKIGFHHYQLGLLLILVGFTLRRVDRYKSIESILMGVGLALFIDQYTYIFSLVGIKFPFSYRSPADYLIISFLVIGLVLYWKFLDAKTDY